MRIPRIPSLVPCLLSIACNGPTPGVAPASCAIMTGTYTLTTVVTEGAAGCNDGTHLTTWPPTVSTEDGGTVAELCDPMDDGSACYTFCAPPPPASGATFAFHYTVTASGFSGNFTGGLTIDDGGAVETCTYDFVATHD